MSFAQFLTAATLLGAIAVMARSRYQTEHILLVALGVLVLGDVLTVQQAFMGLANEGVATVAILFIVASSLSNSGALTQFSHSLLGRPRGLAQAQLRLMLPVSVFSSVLNNTPVVAMTIPLVSDWCRRMGFPVSKLMIPLSYAAIIGGVCTVIGTSTNLVINDRLQQSQGSGLALFELAWVGLPCVAVVIVFIVLCSRWLLPEKAGQTSGFDDVRQYTVEMVLDPHGPLVGKTVEQADLRELPGLYLAEIIRGGMVIPVIGPRRVLLADDRLVFAGNVDAVVDLKKIDGLLPAEDQVFKLTGGATRSLVEVVISNDYPLLNKTIKQSNFRQYYGAVIIAARRAGLQLKQRLGDLTLKPGDTLLLETNPQFVEKQRYVRDFLVVSPVTEFLPVQSATRWYALLTLLLMLALVGSGVLSMFKAGLLAVAALLLGRATTFREARKSINAPLLLTIAASMGLGAALENSGLALLLADTLVQPLLNSPTAVLALIFALTAVFSAFISNVAAAVLLFPIATAAAQAMGVSVTPYAVAIMVAASACFATPIGYQTNLMVYGPGGYNFMDFIRIGVPLTALVGLVSVLLIPVFWGF